MLVRWYAVMGREVFWEVAGLADAELVGSVHCTGELEAGSLWRERAGAPRTVTRAMLLTSARASDSLRQPQASQPWLPAPLLPPRPSSGGGATDASRGDCDGGGGAAATDASRGDCGGGGGGASSHAIAHGAPLLRGALAWRLHVTSISAQRLPSAESLGTTQWKGLLLRFTASWSAETKRTSLTRSLGPHAWLGEHAVLALPNADTLPPSELAVELCSRVPGRADATLARATLTIGSRALEVPSLALLSTSDPAALDEVAVVGFRIDVVGLTRDQAEREATIAAEAPPLPKPPSKPPHAHGLLSSASAPSLPSGGAAAAVRAARGSAGDSGGGPDLSSEPLALARSASVTATGHAPSCACVTAPVPAPSCASPVRAPAPVPAPAAAGRGPAPPTMLGFGTSVPRRTTHPSGSTIGRRAGRPPVAVAAGVGALVNPPPTRDLWLRPPTAPSARLLMQLDECARIKEAFVRAGLACPTVAIERGLLTPEDRPYDLCASALPRPAQVRPVPAAEAMAQRAAAARGGPRASGGKKAGKAARAKAKGAKSLSKRTS